ncbi:efflux transporter outer membrane subunit [Methylomicrobium album]|uniref:Efflux transporter, outer membrane factor lipoprotein, NodT family n=1 Tax=Methylomicrobium album BG8 TaxID=686340 RepID=H8GGJ1_METAL|nr:efflux transporter outer membrane subunit [Methylomicrobium album]EIC28787.1 efflux transporter, outer membrane factor lipoprotein, NodT family [Methylomicrobium album BG8]
MKTTALISALLVLPAAGCTVGPDYRPPITHAPAQWSDHHAGSITRRNDRLGEWWKLFHDAELDSLIQRALVANLDLRMAESRVRQARSQQGFAEADFWPTVNASGAYTRQKQSQNQPILGSLPNSSNIPFENDVYKAGFDASWEIDLFGGKRRALEAATAELAAMEYGRRGVLVTLLSEVARYYALTRGAQRQWAILQDQIEAQEETVKITRSRVDHGSAAELELQRALALLASVQSQAPIIETSIQSSIHRLGVLLAQSPDALNTELSATAAIPAPPPQVPVGLPSDLLLRRPDVLRAERLLAAETARIGQVKAELFPKFSLTGSAGLISISASDFFLPSSRTWSIGPTVQWRIFDAGRVLASINAQTEAQDQALLNYQKIILTSFEEVETALITYAKEQEHYQRLEQEVNANQRAVELASQRYAKGWTGYLDLLDAQRTLYISQDEWVRSKRAVTLNLVALYKALGGGWETKKP